MSQVSFVIRTYNEFKNVKCILRSIMIKINITVTYTTAITLHLGFFKNDVKLEKNVNIFRMTMTNEHM